MSSSTQPENILNPLLELKESPQLPSPPALHSLTRFCSQSSDQDSDLDKQLDKCKNAIAISAEVQSTIDQVLSSDDPLDKPDFDLVAYVNSIFPNEQSLANIDDVLLKMKFKIQQLDEEIRMVVREQTEVESEGKQALHQAADVIRQLTARIAEIKTKAKDSERMVNEITCDIKQLDNAKRNLTSSIVMLNNLHILVEGVTKLEEAIDTRTYAQAAAVLQSLIGVLAQLERHRDNEHIQKMAAEVEELKRRLSEQILQDFETVFEQAGGKPLPARHATLLSDACLVVDTLGSTTKHSFFEWFITLRLLSYGEQFPEDDENAWLGNVDKRYAWFKRFLEEFEEGDGKLFPFNWHLGERISVEFCRQTGEQLAKLITKRKNDLNVKLLLFAFNKTSLFEKFLFDKFSGVTLLEGVHKKAEEDSSTTNPFAGLINSFFEPHLSLYVECQDKFLEKMISEFVESMQKSQQENARGEVRTAEIFSSTGLLFNQYKVFLVQFVELSKKRPLVMLASTFQKYLREYAQKILLASLQRVSGATSSGSTLGASLVGTGSMFSVATSGLLQSLLKDGDDYKLARNELVTCCSVLLTANRCMEIVEKLEQKLKKEVEPAFADKIDMKAEQELFQEISNNCISLLMRHIDAGCEGPLNTMVKTQWAQVQTPIGPCPYVNQLAIHLQTIFPFIRENLQDSRKHFAFLCNQFAQQFTTKFLKCLFKCKPLKEAAAEQLLHDTHTLKKLLQTLPIHDSDVKTAPADYTKTILKGMTKAETILQVILVPVENRTEHFISSFMKLLPDSNLAEFQKILEMKDVKKAELVKLLEAFRTESSKSGLTNIEENFNAYSFDDSGKIKHLESLIQRNK